MFLKTPQFWYRPPGILAYALMPFAWLYQIAHIINQWCKPKPYQSKIPVICIGNAIAGGGGKTPTVIALANLLQNHNPYILTRGYGGTIKCATLVDLKKHTAHGTGDEALLLARAAPTIIAQNRADGAKLAEEKGAGLILMDDGFFNAALHKDINLMVIDRQIDFGNGKTLPAGPLREPLSKILPRVHGIICIGRPFHSDKTVFEGDIKTRAHVIDKTQNYIAFAGLALPDKFKNTLLDGGANIIEWHPFPDHYAYTAEDIGRLKDRARQNGATLITTEKDFVRLSPDMAKDIKTLPIEMVFKNPDTLVSFIEKASA